MWQTTTGECGAYGGRMPEARMRVNPFAVRPPLQSQALLEEEQVVEVKRLTSPDRQSGYCGRVAVEPRELPLGEHPRPATTRLGSATGWGGDRPESGGGALQRGPDRAMAVIEVEGVLPDGAYETLARAIHEDYVRRQRERGAAPDSNPSMVGWDELPETLKRSNRDQARHIAAKLAAVGCEIEPLAHGGAEQFSFSAEELELLSRMEHDRWWRDREADGWTFAPEKDAERKKSPYLLPWQELPEEIREYDRDTVRGLPALLAEAGFHIVRKRDETSSE